MRRLLAALVLALGALLVASAPAGAHAELVDADPEVEGTVREGHDQITLTLAGLDPAREVDVEVTDPAGEDVTAGDPTVDDRRSTVEIATEPLQPGQHIVHWHVWSEDGDPSEGTYTFTVTEAPRGGLGIWLVWFVALAIPAAIFLRPGARRRPAH